MKHFMLKRLGDGRAVLNLACGTRMHPEWNNIDFSIYAKLRPIESLFQQMVDLEPQHWKLQRPLVRFLQLKILGDARKTGIAHRWMYDRYSLRFLLEYSGFWDIRQVNAFTSQVDDWERFRLDVNTDGSEYKPQSLYMEAKRSL